MKLILKLFLFIFLVSIGSFSYAQDLLAGKDLSQLKSEQLSDADLLKYQQQLKASGISEAQAEQIAIGKGLPVGEAAKIRQRLATLTQATATANTSGKNNTSSVTPPLIISENATSAPSPLNPRVFGAELFTTSSLTFQPDLKIATPMNYELGPDDELSISVYGLQEASFNLPISPEGIISIPNVGQIKVSGLTFEAAMSRIRTKMSGIYSSLRSGSSKLAISLSKIRSIRVTILGAARPGTYTLSSLSTLFNALYVAGGPAGTGTFRTIELIRENKVERIVDLYNFLLSGSQADNIRLRENDVIRIPVYKTRVDISGEIKRAGIFELLPGETLKDLIRFASGFTENAYTASIKVTQLTDREKRIADIPASDYPTYKPSTGDVFTVSQILDRYQNRVVITGAVFRPGIFELTERLTIGNLIRRADGLREDAYTGRGFLYRLREDLTSELIPFDIAGVLANKNDLLLKREDNIIIPSIFELKDEYNVTIQGEVRKAGGYKYIDTLTLKDLILQAGGFTYAAYPKRIEIARIIRRDTLTVADRRLSQIIEISDVNDLTIASKNLNLEPFDVVTIRRMPGFLSLESVSAEGQFQFPGLYVLEKRDERISDLVRRAGGLAPEAFADAGYLRRKNDRSLTKEIDIAKIDKIQQQLKDSSGRIPAAVGRSFDQIPIDLKKIISNPGSEIDMILKAGDILYVPRNDLEIKITGEVLYPTQAIYSRNNRLKDYISASGGFTDNARKSKIYVLYPNGKAARTKKFLFIRNFPEVKPGTEIIVPNKLAKIKKSTTAETAIFASILASVAGIVIALTRIL